MEVSHDVRCLPAEEPLVALLPCCFSGAYDVPELVSGASPVLASFNCSLGELVSSLRCIYGLA
jgi:hypothetical protein